MELLRSLLLNPVDLIIAAIDITLVAYVLYRFILLIRGTRAVQLIVGVIIVLAGAGASRLFKLYTLTWLLDKVILVGAVALPVVFQPELRRALEQLGRGRLFTRGIGQMAEADVKQLIDQLVRAADILSRTKTGALVVIERETGLSDYIEAGIKVDGQVSAELITNIFVPNTPLHDGAVIVRGNRVAAAACILPLVEGSEVAHELGTRHRAAMGVTEGTDALGVVVSEETGIISLAWDGHLQRHLDPRSLRELLTEHLKPKQPAQFSFWNWGSG